MSLRSKWSFLVILLLTSFITAWMAPIAFAFNDTIEHWASFYIDHLTNKRLLSGYPDGSFAPENPITREEFVSLLVSVIHKNDEAAALKEGSCYFTDCTQSWARGAIELARELNIIWGDKGQLFQPQRYTTREEAAVMLVKALGESLPDDPGKLGFADRNDISREARPYVAYAVQVGLLQGMPDNTFRPGELLSRAQVAVLMDNFQGLKGEAYDFYGVLIGVDPAGYFDVNIDNRQQRFALAANIIVYDRGDQSYASSIPLDTYIQFDVDSQGQITFVRLCDPLDTNAEIRYVSLPRYYYSESDSSGLEFASESLEDVPQTIVNDPDSSMDLCRSAMKTDQFCKESGATGSGQLIAVIDSGIDPGHPDLYEPNRQKPKIVDFVDLTDEGKIDFGTVCVVKNGVIKTNRRTFNVKGVLKDNAVCRYGVLNCSVFDAYFKQGLKEPSISCLMVSDQADGDFDTVYLDLDYDNDFSDEQAFHRYADQYQIGVIYNNNHDCVDFVVAEIGDNGEYARLGFDSLGHGTAVAGVAAANGAIKGIAPGADILPIKIVQRYGAASLDSLKDAISIAQERGAGIAIISMGQASLNDIDRNRLDALAADVWASSGMILVMAAGNNGPGVGSVSDTAQVGHIVSVGAYATPEMWKTDYGWEVGSPTLYNFSPAGPGDSAELAPLLVAPGGAMTCWPLWSGKRHSLVQGTSIAAPNLAGALALLLEKSPGDCNLTRRRMVLEAVLAGATPLPGFQPVEQGYGAVDATAAWTLINNSQGIDSNLDIAQDSPGISNGQGLFCLGLPPASFDMTLANSGVQELDLNIKPSVPWILPSQYTLKIPPGEERSLQLAYSDMNTMGLYSALFVADDGSTPGFDAVALQSVIIPVRLAEMEHKSVRFSDSLAAGQFKRYFVEVPEDSQTMQVNLDISGSGRVRMNINAPDGKMTVSEFVGFGTDKKYTAKKIDMPVPGIWEIDVYSSASLSDYDGGEASGYDLLVNLGSSASMINESESPQYLVSMIPGYSQTGTGLGLITLKFWDPATKRKAEGIVAINGKFYEIQNGMVQIERPSSGEKFNIEVGW